MTDVFARLAAATANHYRLEREVGAGGMATAYLAHDAKHELTRLVASTTRAANASGDVVAFPSNVVLADRGHRVELKNVDLTRADQQHARH